MNKTKVVVILGPTSSGKSDLAVSLALRLRSGQAKKFGINDAEIISADSRQVYKGLDLGTGKIRKSEMKGVKHHLLDVASPKKTFSASHFVKLADKAIEDIASRGKPSSSAGKLPIICGGTGFYISTLLREAQMSEVPPNPTLRKKLEKKSTEQLFEMLQRLDPDRAANIDAKNPHRLIRAIEIASFNLKNRNRKAKISRDELEKYDVLKIGIAPMKKPLPLPPPLRRGGKKNNTLNTLLSEGAEQSEVGVSYFLDEERLKDRIKTRLEKRIKQGMIKEAEELHKQGLTFKRMRELGLEYGALADLLQKKIDRTEMIEILQNEIWHFVKRQMTWWKRDKSIIWLNIGDAADIESTADIAIQKINEFLRR
jgi:tRNA dimethylallyltransferase